VLVFVTLMRARDRNDPFEVVTPDFR
jgi:hypothetical protein